VGALDAGAPDDAGTEVCATGATYDYVLAELRPSPVFDIYTDAFNVDARPGGMPDSCGQPDYLGTRGRTDLDNAFYGVQRDAAELLGGSFVDGTAAAIESGSELRMLRVSGVDSLTDDDCVTVEIFDARMPAGVDTLDVAGLAPQSPVPGQALIPVLEDFDATGRAHIFGRGAITAGVLSATGEAAVVRLWHDALPDALPLPLSNFSIAARIDRNALRDGLVGGVSSVAELSTAIRTFAPDASSDDLDAIELQATTRADVGEGGVCSSISSAFQFEAVSVNRGNPQGTFCGGGSVHSYALAVFAFADPDATTPVGDDLDGLPGNIPAACGHADLAGQVDNSLAVVLPDVGPLFGDDFEFQPWLQSGAVLLLTISEVDDLINDDCVRVELVWGLYTGSGSAPLENGYLAPDLDYAPSSISIDPSGKLITRVAGQLQDGVLHAEGIELRYVLYHSRISGGPMQTDYPDLELRAQVHAQDVEQGVLTGAVDLSYLRSRIQSMPVGQDVKVQSYALLDAAADLRSLDTCDLTSAAFQFLGVAATRSAAP
jgi:hypothetical protein